MFNLGFIVFVVVFSIIVDLLLSDADIGEPGEEESEEGE